MNEGLKELLLRCQVHLEEGELDKLVETLEKVLSLDLRGLRREEYEESLKILDFLIENAEKKKLQIAEKLMNLQRFKRYTQSG